MKRRSLLWFLILVLIAVVAAAIIEMRVQSRLQLERRREVENATQAIGRTFVPDTSPPQFSR